MKIALRKYYDNNIEMICADGLKRHCYTILTGVKIYYKKQVFKTGVKTNIQYSVCHVFLQKQKNLTKS